MSIDNRRISESLLSNINDLKKSVNEISVYDLNCYTAIELYYEIANKLNEVIKQLLNHEVIVSEEVLKQNECLQYLLNQGLRNEVIIKIDELAENGFFDEIIYKPHIETINLQRLGRKIEYGEHPNSINYISTGKPCMMQGGCKINEHVVAYMLWDNINIDLNKNKLIVMNLNTGCVIKQKEFTFGWCNSLAFYDNKIYVAERGNNDGNNSKIHVIDFDSLLEVETLNLEENINAISINNGELYVLREATEIVDKYSINGLLLIKSIPLEVNLNGLYNQNLLVTDYYIYLLSSGFSNSLNIFNKDGKIIKSINIPKYGGRYIVGEPQFICELDNNHNMVMGSVISYFNEFTNQFFKFNLLDNITVEQPINNYANLIYVNSDTDYFNPTGEQGNEFKTINECCNLNIRNMIIEGNNKDYKYTYISDNEKYIRLQNAKFKEGCFIQYSNLVLKSCTINKSISSSDNSCLRLRDTTLFLDNCSFDGNNEVSCLNLERNNIIKIITPKFTNYTGYAINNSGSGNIIDFNNYENMPFVRHSNLKKYSLFSKGFINNHKIGTYNYNTDLTESEIQTLLDNCTRVKIIYQSLNNSTKVIELLRTSSQLYSFVDSTVSSSSVNLRVCKTQLKLMTTGYTINSNTTTVYDGINWSVKDSETYEASEMFNVIRSIELIP